MLAPGQAGAGFIMRLDPSPYRGSDDRADLVPLGVYDGRFLYVSPYRVGLKLELTRSRVELFLQRRLEGFASDDVPSSMAGMARREFGTDVGVSARIALGQGNAYAEYLRDAESISEGSELVLGYRYERWWKGRLRVRPYAALSWRDSKLNDYYYGVRPEEATPERPAYRAGSGFGGELGVQAAYRLTEHWQVLAALGASRASGAVRDSPVVDGGTAASASLGLLWSFEPQPPPAGGRKPLIMRFYYGDSTDCNMMDIVLLQCTETHTLDPTSVWSLEVGERLVQGLYDWPVDIAAFVGLLRQEARGRQPDAWQVNAYLKPYYYGFPWSKYVRTRFGFGVGVSYASRPPFPETSEQARRGRDSSKFLIYADPSIDVSVGDLARAPSLRETYVGLGISHRSGVFGASRVFGNVDGGSNYIYAFIESAF